MLSFELLNKVCVCNVVSKSTPIIWPMIWFNRRLVFITLVFIIRWLIPQDGQIEQNSTGNDNSACLSWFHSYLKICTSNILTWIMFLRNNVYFYITVLVCQLAITANSFNCYFITYNTWDICWLQCYWS